MELLPRAELRVFSYDMVNTVTHFGPVFALDENSPFEHEEAFEMSAKRFAAFNDGYDYFGDHNKDKNGEVTIPISVEIFKKELREERVRGHVAIDGTRKISRSGDSG